MKKLLVVFLSLALIFAFAACNQQEAPVEEEPAAEETQVVTYGHLAMNGMTQDEYNQWRAETFPVQSYTIFYDDLSSMLLALDKGDIDSIRSVQPVAEYLAALDPRSYVAEIHDNSAVICSYSMAVAKENTVLAEKINATLDALEADGTLDALKAQYIENIDPANMPAPAELPRFDGAETVRVVVTGDQPPIDYMTADGQAAGYNIALLTAIARQAQINFELVSANSASRTLMITSGKADLIFRCIMAEIDGETVASGDTSDEVIATHSYLGVPIASVVKAQPEEQSAE